MGTALTLLTFLGRLAALVFVPLAGILAQRYGWREAVLLLGVVPTPASRGAPRA